MRTRTRLRRLRRSALRRRSDVIEVWTALLVTVLLLVGAPLGGAFAGWWAHDEARSLAAAERAERHRVRAEVTGRTPDTLPYMEAATSQHTYRVAVRWTEPDGRVRTVTARVPAGVHRGDRVDVWLDPRGRSVAPPSTRTAVWQHTFCAGACGTAAAVALVLLGQGTVRRVALRHRMAEWERDWARTEPEWTRRHRA
ncbi:hypothetical protein ACFV0T_29040 [Streptomyces sp. NPDC059582]|uniref:Rv1733c family protein n=1 Tax=Streptomyces sp. NPDC059582 TaxID=3346875 RepID=UPI0036C89E78